MANHLSKLGQCDPVDTLEHLSDLASSDRGNISNFGLVIMSFLRGECEHWVEDLKTCKCVVCCSKVERKDIK